MKVIILFLSLALLRTLVDNYQISAARDRAETQLRMIHYREVHNLEDEQDNGIPQPEGLR